MGSSRGLRATFVALGLVVAFATPARADEPDAGIRVAARELAITGAEAFDQQDYATALDRFQRAEELYRAPSISVMVARCLAQLGRLVEAVDKYEETRRMALDATAPEAFQRAVADANAEVEAVRARVARLQVRVPHDGPAELEVRLDDKPLPRALLGVDIPVDPGTHRIVARARGHAPFTGEVVMMQGERQQVEIIFRAPEPAPTPTPTPTQAPSRAAGFGPDAAASPSLAPGLVLLTGGGVALAAGVVTGIVALNHKSELDANCRPGCPPSMKGDLDSYRVNRTVSYVSLGVGLAAAGVGGYLLLHRGPSGAELAARLGPGGAALTGRF